MAQAISGLATAFGLSTSAGLNAAMGSLRTRILATYALVAVLPLTLAGVVALGLFARHERQAALAGRGMLLAAVTAGLGDIAEAPREALAPFL